MIHVCSHRPPLASSFDRRSAAGTTVSGMSADISIPVLPENRRQRIKKPAR
ncbi:hypothetical protein BIFADO_01719 [Bifidobacterium adolescentis L2-32]|uniref:Uncharacterized protein n=1 Tax=Bifidobacterium adolescentis L2-32 TaxID=411481 RepID=A7A784_BIFAD|nr:hypothetical protein BIFADO_01719 [Bifidobacterium adolescentis L2-32]